MKESYIGRLIEILIVSLRLGLTSFGGPVAHLGYFREEYVERRKWLKENEYADLVALCQFLPGPASSQVGIGIGIIRAGIPGGIISFLGFTTPSVIILILAAVGFQQQGWVDIGVVDGLKIVAAAVVAHAIIGMGQNSAPDKLRATIAAASFIILILLPQTWMQISVIAGAALLGIFIYKQEESGNKASFTVQISQKTAYISLGLFFGLLAFLPIVREWTDFLWIQMFDSFYRAGALVFGGGHVVLPLLEREVVPAGLVTEEIFLAGYGAAQAVPGPLFTFASYLGMAANGIPGALIATAAIFLPAFLLVIGTFPFWMKLSTYTKARAALKGVNAAVIGILLAAFYDPIFTSAINSVVDLAFAVSLFVLLMYWKVPAWKIVLLGIGGGMLVHFI